MSKRGAWGSWMVLLLVGGLAGCGGGGSSSSGQQSGGFTAPTMQGQYQIIATSNSNPGEVLLIESNFTQAGTEVMAGAASVVTIEGTQGSSGITLSGLGGECDGGAVGDDTIQATFSSATQLGFTLTEAGPSGTGTTTGTVTVSADGSQITSGTYNAAAACGLPADSGTITGAAVGPFSGSYAGMLTNTSNGTDAVIVTVSQTGLNLNVTGTDSGTPFTLTGSVTGATFNVSGTISGQAVQYVGVYDSQGNDFLVFDASLDYLGTLNAGTNPARVAKTVGILRAGKRN